MLNGLSQKRYKYAALGALLSFIGPLGEWIVIKVFFGSIEDYLFVTLIYLELLCLFLFSAVGYILGTNAEKIEGLAYRDHLTGLYNRHYLFERIAELIELHNRYHEKFSIVMIDLDKFKDVNDTYGHAVGDKTIHAVARCISKEIRNTDFAGRYGGEEFIVVCPSTGDRDCYELAERIRVAVKKLKPRKLGYPGPQTISAGVFSLDASHKEMSIVSLINNADLALYDAKGSGRNSVKVYQNDREEVEACV